VRRSSLQVSLRGLGRRSFGPIDGHDLDARMIRLSAVMDMSGRGSFTASRKREGIYLQLGEHVEKWQALPRHDPRYRSTARHPRQLAYTPLPSGRPWSRLAKRCQCRCNYRSDAEWDGTAACSQRRNPIGFSTAESLSGTQYFAAGLATEKDPPVSRSTPHFSSARTTTSFMMSRFSKLPVCVR